MRSRTIWSLAGMFGAMTIFGLSLYAQKADPALKKIDDPRVRAYVAVDQPHHPGTMHQHKFNRVLIYMDDGEMTFKTPDGKVEKIQFKKGDARWSPAGGPHVSENISDHPVRIVEIELHNTPKTPAPVLSKIDPLKADPKHYSLVFENAQTRVLRVRFGPNEKGVQHEHTFPGVVVYLNDQARGKAGEMRLDEPRTHSEQNPLNHPVERLSIDIK
jgi:quercetin dioxygenase-like cupin family protein